MSSKNMEGKIRAKIKELHSADEASIIIAINQLDAADKDAFLRTLTTITEKGSPREKIEKEKKPREESTFLANLKVKLEDVKRQGITVKTDYKDCTDDLRTDITKLDTTNLIAKFNYLSGFIASLDVLNCLLEFKRREIISLLKLQGNSVDDLEVKLNLSPSYINRLNGFYKLASNYPALVYTGYSAETLLRFKSLIEGEAQVDINFESSLKIQVDYKFENDETRRVVSGSLIDM